MIALDPALAAPVSRYLTRGDRLLPGRIQGFYLIGSAALGAFRARHSDVDFVAVLDRDLTPVELRRLRMLHAWTAGESGVRALARGRIDIPGTCNGSYIRADDLTTPVTRIQPVASHVGERFRVGKAFDVNPVMWKVLAERGVTIRGPEPGSLGLDPEPDKLRAWNLDNLAVYWRGWGEAASRGRPWSLRRRHPRWPTAWGVLGAPRLHCTIATGEVVSKEAAGEYALTAFDDEWHPIIREGLAFWLGEPPEPGVPKGLARTRRAGAFVLEVVRSAQTL